MLCNFVKVGAIAALVLLAGCSAIESKVISDVGNATVTQADLDGAIAMADAAGDKDAAACYRDVKDFVASQKTAVLPAIKGAFSALEAARVAALTPPVQVPAQLHRDCAVIILDAQETALRLGLKLRNK